MSRFGRIGIEFTHLQNRNKMEKHLEKITANTQALRQEIINHPVYTAIKDLNDLKVFMQFHVYAVWDFMSLLKALQNNLTCTSVPWFPKGTGDTRFLINEIVVGEESDVDSNGIRKSHFEIYLNAMRQCGADTFQIEKFLDVLMKTGDFDTAYKKSETPDEAKEFVNFTFEIINSRKDFLQAAIFTFGREDLIPDMFIAIVNDIHRTFPESISVFKYYLERHIEVDGDHHSHLAKEMISSLCKDDLQLWEQAEVAVKKSLQMRINLWDGAYKMIKQKAYCD
jgi:hypothetical protein